MEINSYLDDWHDSSRERTVPVRIYLPTACRLEGKRPVVLLSHGLGGSRDGFEYLGRNWSEHGYVVIALQHPGSDIDVRVHRAPGETIIAALAKNTTPKNAQDRVNDVRFVLDQLEQGRLETAIDMNRIALGGHSFGSHTTFALIGRAPYEPDARIKAAVVMSPNTPEGRDPQKVHQRIATPILHLTGTRDRSPIDKKFDPIDRRIPFDHITGCDQYYVVFRDGTHLLFSGHARPLGLTLLEQKYQSVIADLIRRYFDAYLSDDPSQHDFFEQNLHTLLENIASVEVKRKSK